jgi:ADP-ribose pyrophosphatase YjhB (NUDIX family)
MMPKPITPLAGCDVFILDNDKNLLLIQRTDNNLWALPGGYQELGETPKECAVRECLEETGYEVEILELIGVFSSLKYELKNYPLKDIEICHLFFLGKVKDGKGTTSNESKNIQWFPKNALPQLSDGHDIRINYGWEYIEQNKKAYFE